MVRREQVLRFSQQRFSRTIDFQFQVLRIKSSHVSLAAAEEGVNANPDPFPAMSFQGCRSSCCLVSLGDAEAGAAAFTASAFAGAAAFTPKSHRFSGRTAGILPLIAPSPGNSTNAYSPGRSVSEGAIFHQPSASASTLAGTTFSSSRALPGSDTRMALTIRRSFLACARAI